MMDKSHRDGARDEVKPGQRSSDKPGRAAAAKPARKGAAKREAMAKAKPVAKTADKTADSGAMTAKARAGGARASVSVVRKKEFVERVQALSDSSKAATKGSVDATLRVLAEAILAGEALAIAGFGKTRVSRHVSRAGADTYVLRFKPMQAKDDAKGVEEDDDDV